MDEGQCHKSVILMKMIIKVKVVGSTSLLLGSSKQYGGYILVVHYVFILRIFDQICYKPWVKA